jgi:hypothetical protein
MSGEIEMNRKAVDHEPTIRQRLRYRFDNVLARGTWAVLAWLGIITLAVVVLASLSLRRVGVTLSGSTNEGWFEDFWQSLLRTLDTGTMAGDTGFRQRLVALVVTLFGVLVAGTVIGVIASGVESQIDRMKRGRSTVIESDHVVVLGASSMLPVVVDQLVLANAAHPTAIVVLADGDPSELSDDVRQVVGSTRGCRLVFRSGDPMRHEDLDLVRVGSARSVVVLNGDGARSGDATAAHTVLAVRQLLGPDSDIPVIVMLDDLRVAGVIGQTGGPTVHPLVMSRAVGRNAAFALRERGLGEVMDQLTDFRGSDICVADVPGMTGLAFAEIVTRSAGARPIGVFRSDGVVLLNPDPALVPNGGDRLIVVAEHAQAATLRVRAAEVDAGGGPAIDLRARPAVEHLVVIGWNSMASDLLEGWALTVAPESTVRVICDAELIDAHEVDMPPLDVASVDVAPILGGALGLDSSMVRGATTIVLLSSRDLLPYDDCDSHSLLELLTLQQHLAGRTEVSRDGDGDGVGTAAGPRLVVELLDEGNSSVARSLGATDILVSPAMASRLLAQLADQPERRSVYLALYEGGGVSLHLVSAASLGLEGEVTMPDLVRSAVARGALAIGWRRGGVTRLNPPDDERVRLGPGDQIIVVG